MKHVQYRRHQQLGAIIQTVVAATAWDPGFVHPCFERIWNCNCAYEAIVHAESTKTPHFLQTLYEKASVCWSISRPIVSKLLPVSVCTALSDFRPSPQYS